MSARAALWVALFVVFAFALSGCSDAKAGAYKVGGPDEYGVVCYAGTGVNAFSCVKVR